MTSRAFELEFDASTRARLVGGLVLVCGNRADAEDAAQEALAKAWSRWSSVRRKDSPQAWVWKVAFNAAKARGRRKGAEQRALNRLEPPTTDTPSAVATQATDRLAIRAALQVLPERQRQAIVCRYYSGLTVAETAAAMGCATGTVKALTSQAITGLRALGLVELNQMEVSRADA